MAGARKPPGAALYYVPDGYSTAGPGLMGIQAASEGVLQAMARHGGMDPFMALVDGGNEGESFRRVVANCAPDVASGWIATAQSAQLARIGAVQLPGPGLSRFAWTRARHGSHLWSLIGVTHSLSTPGTFDDLIAMATAPVMPWDALICTSNAARAMVGEMFAAHQSWLRERLGRIKLPLPQLPVIPLGVDTAAFAPDTQARLAWRARLGLREEDVAVLYFGRFSARLKMHPLPLFQAMARAAAASPRPLVLLLVGWFHGERQEAWAEAAARFCPGVRVVVLDGRQDAVRRQIRSCADMFVLPADNIQETFGLAPVEAMAAGLPVIVSDWDGFRDTVRDGIDGFRVPTIALPPGPAAPMAELLAEGRLEYDAFVGAVAQTALVDVGALAEAIRLLANDVALRRRMGDAALRRARASFDWAKIIPSYRALWADLAKRRAAAARQAPRGEPARPDPWEVFSAWPTRQLVPTMRLRPRPGASAALAAVWENPLVAPDRPFLPERRELERLLAMVEASGDVPLRALLGALGRERGPQVQRALLWLAKFDLLEIGAAGKKQ